MDELVKKFLKPDIMLLVVIVLCILIGQVVFKLKYASVLEIVSKYMSCFKNRDGKIMIVPIIYYFGIPLLMALITVSSKRLEDAIINIVTIKVSILTAMLFTLLTMIIDMKSKIQQNNTYYSTDANLSKKALIQTYYTVMFEILLSIVILILCLFNVFVKEYSYVQSFLVYYLVFLLLINLFIILKRIYKVIDFDMEK